MVYHPRGPVNRRRTRCVDDYPEFVADLGAHWKHIDVARVTLAIMVHVWDGAQNIVWCRLVREYLPNLCGPLSIPAATQVASMLGPRVQWLSELHTKPAPMHDEHINGELPHEPTFHFGEKNPGPRKGPVKAHL